MIRLLLTIAFLSTVSLNAQISDQWQFDPTFGTDGRVTPAFNNAELNRAIGLHVRSDGMTFVCAATAMGSQQNQISLAAFDPGGMPIPFYGDNGVLLYRDGHRTDAYDVHYFEGGDVIVSGSYWPTVQANEARPALYRFTVAGQLDETFGENGKASVGHFGQRARDFNSIHVLPDGRIIGVCIFASSIPAKVGIARFDSQGALDSTYGDDGIVVHEISDGTVMYAGSVLEPETNSVVFGFLKMEPNARYQAVRIDSNGAVAASATGMEGRTFEVDADFSRLSMCRSSIGDIYFVGTHYNVGVRSMQVAKLNTTTLQEDLTFGSDGYARASRQGGYSATGSIVLDDGSILVVGNRSLAHPGAVAKFTPQGMLDPTFNGTGIQEISLLGTSDLQHISHAAFTDDGKVVLTGQNRRVTEAEIPVARMNQVVVSVDDNAAMLEESSIRYDAFNNVLSIHHSQATNLAVYALSGTQVFSCSMNIASDMQSIALPPLPTGMYVAVLTTHNNVRTVPFAVVR